MTVKSVTSRRRILKQLGLLVGGGVFPSSNSASQIEILDNRQLSVAIDRLIAHRGSAAIIGSLYLEINESERSIEVLAQNIVESISTSAKYMDETTLLNQIRVDFERGDIVNLKGWLLSRTEARICALHAV